MEEDGPDGVIEIEDQDEEENEDEEEESDDDGGYEDEELIPSVVTSPRVSNVVSRAGNSQEAVVLHDDLVEESNCKRSCKGNLGSQESGRDDGDEDKFNGGEIDGLFCPICIEAWTSGGEHQICCLPCGHIYGLSCIKKWLRQRRGSGKCPQCNKKCTLKDIRVLYAARLCVVDAELQKQVRSLETKCASLQQKNVDCCKKEVEAAEREANLNQQVKQLQEACFYLFLEAKHLKRLLENKQRESQASFTINQGYKRRVINGHNVDNGCGSQAPPGLFKLQREFQVEGGRYFDMDETGQVMIVARRLNGMGGRNLLTKISLLAPSEREDIELPANTKAVRALCVRPCSRLVLLASLGKKLTVVSTESNNTVLTYELPAPAWSCSWDVSSPHHVYTGLQNGMVLAFDMRQTRTALESRMGLSCSPVHTMTALPPDSSIPSAIKTLLTASQIGLCEWSIDANEERPYLIPESENQGVCISLAHSNRDNIVASFRPKVQTSADTAVSQPLPTSPEPSGVPGCHIFYKKTGTRCYKRTGSMLAAQMENVRLPKSTIINKQNYGSMFVFANETTSDLVLHDMSKMLVVQRLKVPKNQISDAISDVRCSKICDTSVLGCISGDVVQLFT
uniref:RING-type E3 ubiquitin transferase n=1 Tax=Lactuca sativa TaxID=4236 RepID=A0A9R1WJ98_LACSA|nr:hypothetical protein LSAT_V11C200061470 [Lactuca sativa]